MKLPWDEKYLKISFHVIFTSVVIYFLIYVMKICFYALSNVGEIMGNVSQFFSGIISIFSILFFALIIAYLLDPLVNHMQMFYNKISHKKIVSDKRTAGTILTYALIFSVISLFIFITVKKINANGRQNFIDNLSTAIVSTINDLNESYKMVIEKLDKLGAAEHFSKFISTSATSFIKFFSGFTNNIINILTTAGGKILDVALSLVIAFYLLRDKKYFHGKISEVSKLFLPPNIFTLLTNIFDDINVIFSGYINGQLLDALIMAILLSGWLSLARVKFAVIIGIFSGFANIIPYFGAFFGFVLAIISSLLSGEPIKAVYAALGIMILQQIDGMFIVPKIVGERVELSPFFVILSLSVAGKMFGILGMILAVPTCAIIKIFISRFIARRKKKFVS